MVPDPHLMRHPKPRTGGRDTRRLSRTFQAQSVVNRHRLNRQTRPYRQMQKGGGIPTARHRNSNRLARRKRRPDPLNQPVRAYWHPRPCIDTVAWVAAMLAG